MVEVKSRRCQMRSQVVGIALVVLGVITVDANAQTPHPGSAPVSIVNPVPLPVTGNVNIVNPSPLPVTGNVSVSGNVTVAAQETFQTGTVSTSISNGAATKELIVVPAGKRLVLEGVTANVNVSSVGGLSTVNVAIAGDRVNEMVCRPHGETANGLNHWFACSTMVKLYAESGQTVSFGVFTADSSSTGFYRVFASGYFVPVP
jgi:hypothetical protein